MKTWSIDPVLIVKFKIHEQVLEYLRAGYSRREGIDPPEAAFHWLGIPRLGFPADRNPTPSAT